jgi:endo-1,4-beta-xylanase
MCIVQPEEDVFDFAGADRVIEFAEAHDMQIRGHVLVWHDCFPEWLQGRDLTREEAIAIMHEHIMTVVGRYRGRIAVWDVVNEAFVSDGRRREESMWQQWIGDDYIELAFRFAHEADPDALLFYNDADGEIINSKSNAIYELVRDLRLADVPIHGVGMQMHVTLGEVGEGGLLDPVSLNQNIRRLGQLGLQVEITEMDVAHRGAPNDEIRAGIAGTYYQIFETCLSTPFCTGLITWGVHDASTWLRDPQWSPNPEVGPLLFNDDFEPNPAYDAMRDVLARSLELPPVLSEEQIEAFMEVATVTVSISEPQKSDPSQLAPDSAHGGLYYVAFPVSITLDGETDDWVNIPRDTVFEGPLEDGTTAATFAAAADAEYFFFLAEITDENVVYGEVDPVSNWYQEDSIEFYLNTTGNLTLTDYQPGVVQIGISAANIDSDSETLVGGSRSADAQVEAVVVRTETGYRVEARVPLETEVWSITPQQGGILGFQVHLNGSSGDGRDTKLIWSAYDTDDQSWMNPSVFGQLMFWNIDE